eukprot:2250094-Rhodomonas_salina.2
MSASCFSAGTPYLESTSLTSEDSANRRETGLCVHTRRREGSWWTRCPAARNAPAGVKDGSRNATELSASKMRAIKRPRFIALLGCEP